MLTIYAKLSFLSLMYTRDLIKKNHKDSKT